MSTEYLFLIYVTVDSIDILRVVVWIRIFLPLYKKYDMLPIRGVIVPTIMFSIVNGLS